MVIIFEKPKPDELRELVSQRRALIEQYNERKRRLDRMYKTGTLQKYLGLPESHRSISGDRSPRWSSTSDV